MRKKIKNFLVIIVLYIIFFQNNSFARYYENIKNVKMNGNIAEPIIIVQNLQETITTDFNKNTIANEYYFVIKNYEIENGLKKISEVDFDIEIQVRNKDSNFPVRYELYDCENNEEILQKSDISKKITINKNSEFERKYKLSIYWDGNKEFLSSNDEIDIIVRASQHK